MMMDCYIGRDEAICLMSLIGLAILIQIILTYFIFVRRNLFPLYERQPLLLLLGCYLRFVELLMTPLEYIIEYIASEQESQPVSRTLDLSFGISTLLFMLFVQLVLLRAFRLIYILYTDKPSDFWISVLSSEIIIIVLVLGMYTTLSSVSFILYYFGLIELRSIFTFTETFSPAIMLHLAIVMALVDLNLRKLNHLPYSIHRECILLIMQFQFYGIYLFWQRYTRDLIQCAVIQNLVIDWTFYLIYMYITVYSPIKSSIFYHEQLPQKLLISHIRLYAQNPVFIWNFYVYLEKLDSLNVLKHDKTLNEIHQRIFRIIQRQNADEAEEKIDESAFIELFQRQRKESAFSNNLHSIRTVSISYQSSDNRSSGQLESYLLRNLLQFYYDVLKLLTANGGRIGCQQASKLLQEYFLGDGVLRNRVKKSVGRSQISVPEIEIADMQDIESKSQKSEKQTFLIGDLIAKGQHDMISNIVMEYFLLIEQFLQVLFERKYKKTVGFKVIYEQLLFYEQLTKNVLLLRMTWMTTIKQVDC